MKRTLARAVIVLWFYGAITLFFFDWVGGLSLMLAFWLLAWWCQYD